MTVHLKNRGARKTACGRLISKTLHDTLNVEKVTCKSCRHTEIYIRKYYQPPPEN